MAATPALLSDDWRETRFGLSGSSSCWKIYSPLQHSWVRLRLYWCALLQRLRGMGRCSIGPALSRRALATTDHFALSNANIRDTIGIDSEGMFDPGVCGALVTYMGHAGLNLLVFTIGAKSSWYSIFSSPRRNPHPFFLQFFLGNVFLSS